MAGEAIARSLQRGDFLFTEKPSAALQQAWSRAGALACPGCLRHVGTLDTQLEIAAGLVSRVDALAAVSVHAGVHVLPPVPGVSEFFHSGTFPCNGGCGEVYCSESCRRWCWGPGGHSLLCVGLVEDENHPLFRFKIHALENHEGPFLLAAQMIAGAVATLRGESGPTRTARRGGGGGGGGGRREAGLNEASSNRQCTVNCDCKAVKTLLELFPRGGLTLQLQGSGTGLGGISRAGAGCAGGGAGMGSGMEAGTEQGALGATGVAEEEKEEKEDEDDDAHLFAWREPIGLEVAAESWRLFVSAVEAMGVATDAFPTLLGEKFYCAVVAGLAANCEAIEVRAPLVDYCQSLARLPPGEQEQALQILEPALARLAACAEEDGEGEGGLAHKEKGEHEEGEEEEEEEEVEDSPSNEAEKQMEGGGENESHPSQRQQQQQRQTSERTAEIAPPPPQLAWRRARAARLSASLLPPVYGPGLFPSLARLPHSCAPSCAPVPGPGLSMAAAAAAAAAEEEELGEEKAEAAAGAAAAAAAVAPPAVRHESGEGSGRAGAEEPDGSSAADCGRDSASRLEGLGPGQGAGPGARRPPAPSVGLAALRDLAPGDVASVSYVRTGAPLRAREAALGCFRRLRWRQHWQGYQVEVCEWARAGAGAVAATAGGVQDSKDKEEQKEEAGLYCRCHKCNVQRERTKQEEWRDRSPSLADSARTGLGAVDGSIGAVAEAAVAAVGGSEAAVAVAVWALQAAEMAMEQLRYSDALEALAWALEASPGAAAGPVYEKMGICYVNLGRWNRALHFWRDGIRRAPSHPGLRSEADRYRAYAFWRAAGSLPSEGEPHGQLQRRRHLSVEFTDQGGWVCSTTEALLSAEECARVVQEAEEVAAAGGGWGTTRHVTVPTTDIPVRDLPRTLLWFNQAMRLRIAPLVAAAAALARTGPSPCDTSPSTACAATAATEPRKDGSTPSPACAAAPIATAAASPATTVALEDVLLQERTLQRDEGAEEEEEEVEGEHEPWGISRPVNPMQLRCHDAFVVRYDAAAQRSLPMHTDQSQVSLTLALNPASEYDGGGTYFEGLGRAVRPEVGNAVVFPGEELHGGHPIARGVRYIIAVFLYEVEEK